MNFDFCIFNVCVSGAPTHFTYFDPPSTQSLSMQLLGLLGPSENLRVSAAARHLRQRSQILQDPTQMTDGCQGTLNDNKTKTFDKIIHRTKRKCSCAVLWCRNGRCVKMASSSLSPRSSGTSDTTLSYRSTKF